MTIYDTVKKVTALKPPHYSDGTPIKLHPIQPDPKPRYLTPSFKNPIFPGDPRYENAPYEGIFIIPE